MNDDSSAKHPELRTGAAVEPVDAETLSMAWLDREPHVLVSWDTTPPNNLPKQPSYYDQCSNAVVLLQSECRSCYLHSSASSSLRVVRDANVGHQLAGGNSSWCIELESWTTHRPMLYAPV